MKTTYLALISSILLISTPSWASLNLREQVLRIEEMLSSDYHLKGKTISQARRAKSNDCYLKLSVDEAAKLHAEIRLFNGHIKSENGITYPNEIPGISMSIDQWQDDQTSLIVKAKSLSLRTKKQMQDEVLHIEFHNEDFSYENIKSVSIAHEKLGFLTQKRITCDLLN